MSMHHGHLALQWHQALGFSRHLVYMRPGDVQAFLQQPAVSDMLQEGWLQLVVWPVRAAQRGIASEPISKPSLCGSKRPLQ